ncbi:MAG: hypothetical protein HDT34_01725 [Clostridiales bacterium]|nr:hypothetical protein [Clostridiales bacterium]
MKRTGLFLSIIFILFIFCSCSNYKIPEQTTQAELTKEVSTTIKPTEETKSIIIKIKDKSFKAQLYNNETAKAFAEMLPLTLEMNELNGNEKYYNLNTALPTDISDIGKINNGDIMLYGSNCIVLFYDSFSTNYSYTKIGYIENPTELADAVGNGDITITFDK